MKIVAVICNIVLLAFTCVVLVVDGPATEAAYLVFTLWLLFTLIFNAVVISRRSPSPPALIAAMVCNVVLLGFTSWAFVDQYPHPDEEGLVAFTVLIFMTPILILAALLRSGSGQSWLRLHLKGKSL